MSNPFEDDSLLDETRVREIVRSEIRLLFEKQCQKTDLNWSLEEDTVKSIALGVILDVLRELNERVQNL